MNYNPHYSDDINKLFKEDLSKYEKTLEKLSDYAKESETILFSNEFKNLKSSDKGKFFQTLLNVINGIAFYPGVKSINKLRKYNVHESVIKWFISIEKIKKELERIEKKGIYSFKNQALLFIVLYVRTKTRVVLYKHARLLFNDLTDKKIDLVYDSILFYRRKNYKGKKGFTPKSILDEAYLETAELLNELFPDPKKAKLAHIDFADGRSETFFLNQLIRCFFPGRDFEQTEYLAILAPLLRLICKDKQIWTKSEYEDRESSYENNHPRYLAMRVKRITGFNPANDDFRHFLIHIR